MANQRDASKQKRARQNRAEREARVARAKAAQTPKEQRAAAATGSPSSPSRSTPGAKSAKAKASPKSKRDAKSARSAGAQGRLGQVPVDIDTLQGGFLRKVAQVPGGMQVIMSTVLVLVLTVMNSLVHTMIAKDAPKGAPATQTFFDVYGTRAILLLAPPVILVGNAFIFSLHPRRRRMWTVSAVLLGAFSLVIPQFLFPAGFLGYAVLRSRRVEEPRSPRVKSAGSEDASSDGQ